MSVCKENLDKCLSVTDKTGYRDADVSKKESGLNLSAKVLCFDLNLQFYQPEKDGGGFYYHNATLLSKSLD